MTSRFYVKIVLGIVAILLAVAFIVTVSVAEQPTYPCGMSRVYDILSTQEEVMPGVKGKGILILDTVHGSNRGGFMLLRGGLVVEPGEYEGNIGVMIAVLTEEMELITGSVVFYSPKEQIWMVLNLVTGAEDTITAEGACSFVQSWLMLYDQVNGLST